MVSSLLWRNLREAFCFLSAFNIWEKWVNKSRCVAYFQKLDASCRERINSQSQNTASMGPGSLDGHIFSCLSVAKYGRMFVRHRIGVNSIVLNLLVNVMLNEYENKLHIKVTAFKSWQNLRVT